MTTRRLYLQFTKCSYLNKAFRSKLKSLNVNNIVKDNDWKSIINTLIDDKNIPSQAARQILINYLDYLKKITIFIEFSRSNATHENKDDIPNINNFNTNTHLEGYIRLPKNQPVSVTLPVNRIVNIFLGNHAYKLVTNNKWKLITPDGDKHTIKPGKNTIGRSKKNDICLGKNFNDVSRVHIVIERVNDNTAIFMDTSSLGTCLPKDLF